MPDVLAAICAAVSVLLAVSAARAPRSQLAIDVARRSTMDSQEAETAAEAAMPLWMRFVRPLVIGVASRVRGKWAGLSEEDIRRAGIDPARLRPDEVMALKVIAAGVCATAMLAVGTLVPGILTLLPAVTFAGYIAPSVVIRRRRQARRAQLLRELPDFVGLLKAFVTAGITMEQALHLISAQQAKAATHNLLAAEIRAALSEYGLGLSIDQALQAMAERVGLEELEMLASALAQGKRQGAAMERILRDQEAVIRLGQRNRATAEASRVGTRLVGILVLVYLPEFMVLIMVPLFYGIFLRAFS